MSEVPSPGGASLPLSVELRVDAACRRFEAAWREGRRPRPEDFLGAAEGRSGRPWCAS